MSKENASGEIALVDRVITYRVAGDGWTVNLADVRLIGEYTTANGPCVDDYFFVFLTAPEDGWHQASFYAQGRDKFLSDLSVALGSPIQIGLCNSADWETRILWPLTVAGEPLAETVPKPTRWGRVWDRINGTQDLVLSNAAKSVFQDGE